MVGHQIFFRRDLGDQCVDPVQDHHGVKEGGHCVSDRRHLLGGLGHRHCRQGDHHGHRLHPQHLWFRECVASCLSALLWPQLASRHGLVDGLHRPTKFGDPWRSAQASRLALVQSLLKFGLEFLVW